MSLPSTIPEGSAEASGHVLPQVFAVHGAHEHVHCFDDLGRILVLLYLTVPEKARKAQSVSGFCLLASFLSLP